MRYLKLFWVPVAAGFFISGAWANVEVKTYHYFVHSLAPSRSSDKASVLGEGWSTDNGTAVGQCLTGSVDYVGTPSGSVSMDTVFDYNDVMNQLDLKMDGKLSFLGFQSSSEYAHLLKDTDYSQTFVYRASVLLKNRHFLPSMTQSPLTWIGQQYVTDPVAFRTFCGDKFITEQQIGGALYVAVKFLFHTKQEKNTFNEALQASVGSFASLNSNLAKAAQSVKNSGNVSITAFQIGGDPAKLGQILGAAPGSAQASLFSCDLGHLEACQQAMGQILVYASQSGNGNFPSQFTVDDPQAPMGPGVIQNFFQHYATVVPVKIGPSLVTQEIIDARAQLSQAYEKSIDAMNEVNALMADNVPLSPEFQQKLNTLKTNAEKNNRWLSEAGLSCYEDRLDQCLPQAQRMNEKLLPVDLAPFAKRIYALGVHGYGFYPYSAHQYIMEYANQFRKDEIFTVNSFTSANLTMSLPAYSIQASSKNGGLSYQGIYQSTKTGYREAMTFIPDFNVTE